ncbi:MAG: right-handed parallel beta-helix repeat-containing protein [Deltaproteobacteria bacterium]
MTSRCSLAASSAVLASLLVFASACSDTVDVPIDRAGDGGDGGDGNGGDGGDGGEGADGPAGANGDCPSNLKVQAVCQPDVPVASVADDCDFGVADNQCKPAALKAGTLADCPSGITDGVCDAAPPAFTSWVCPAGSGALPGLHFSDGSSLSVEGVSNFTACQAVWADDCAVDTRPSFGSANCTPIIGLPGTGTAARACPGAGLWPTEAEIRVSAGFAATSTVPIVYANQAGAGAVPDGLTPQTAFSLTAALAAATDGEIVALARDTYNIAPIDLQTGIALVGACAAQTELRPASPSAVTPLIRLSASQARLADVTITGSTPGIGIASDSARVNNVQIVGAVSTGISVSAGNVELSNVLISGTQGPGLSVSGGVANLTGVAFVANSGAAISVSGATSSVVGSDVIVTDTVAAGASVSTGGNLDLTRAVFANNRDAGVLVDGAGSSLALADTFITATVSATAGTLSGAAISAAGGSQVSVQRLLAKGNVLGVRVAGADTTLDLQNSIIADPSAAGANPPANSGVGVLGEGGPGITAQGLVLLRNRGGLITQAGDLQLENVVIAGSTAAPLSATGTDSLLLQTTFADNAGGISFVGGGVDVQDTRVVDTRKEGSLETHAVFVNGADGPLQRLVLARNAEYGLFVTGAKANLDITDLRITDTRSVQDAGKAVRGIGVVVTDPSDPAGAPPAVGITRGIIAQSHDHGVLVTGPGPQVYLTDVSVAQTRAADLPARSGAISFVSTAPATQAAGGLLALERTTLDDNDDSGASVSGPGIELDLIDVSISNTRALSSGEAGAGLSAQNGSILSGRRVQLSNNARTGVAVEGIGTALDLTDLVVSDTQPAGAGPSGEGMRVVGGVATIESGSFLRNSSAGIWAAQGASVDLTDVVLDETQAPAGGSGVGLDVIGAKLTGERVTLSKSHGLGLSASLGAQVTILDLNITGTLAAAIAGRGVEVSSGSTVELNRAVIAGTPDYALLVAGPDSQTAALLAQFPQSSPLPQQTTLNLYDLSVHDVGGGGLAALLGATLEIDTFDIRAAAVGMQLVEGVTLTAASGNITSNPLGVNVQGGSTIDLTKVFQNVVVTGNTVNNDTRDLPVPALSDVLSRSSNRL